MATNLEFIKSVEVTSSTSSVDVTDVFSDKYDVYMVVTQKMEAVSSATANTIRAITGGSADSSANYDFAALELKESSVFVEQRQTNQTSFSYLSMNAYSTVNGGGSAFYVFNPSDTSSYTFFLGNMVAAVSSLLRNYKSIGVYTQANEVTGFQINTQNPIDTAEILVYGVK